MKRRIALHFAFWLAYWLIYAYTGSRYDGNLPKYLLTEGLQMPARMLATYVSLWCFDRFSGLHNQRFWLAFAGAALAVISGGLLNRLIKFSYLVPVHFPDASIEFWGYRMVYDMFDVLVACACAISARLYFRQQEFHQRETALRHEKINAELLALKSQIHPHFLFNTINNIYALARKKSDKTAPIALKLAQLLRYVLYESSKQTVRLEQEIQLLKDYIELEKLRFDEEQLKISFNEDVDDLQQAISPLLLLPLVENAFKHGVSEVRNEVWININLTLQNKILNFSIRNSRQAKNPENKQGIGLKNLLRQLELQYPERHSLVIQEEETVFSIHLSISL